MNHFEVRFYTSGSRIETPVRMEAVDIDGAREKLKAERMRQEATNVNFEWYDEQSRTSMHIKHAAIVAVEITQVRDTSGRFS